MNKLLKLVDVSLTYQTKYDEVQALKNLSFEIEEGDFVSLIGPSGCGKTTVLSIIAGFIKPTGGKLIFEDNLKGDKLGYMLQKDHLFPWRTIEKNIFLPLEIKGLLDKKHRDYAESLLIKYGLYDFRKNYPNELSGGMRQRVALIRTLVTNPTILLLDEPFSALDYQTRLKVCDDVDDIIKKEKKTAILVTHDVSEAISMSNKIFVLTKRPARLKCTFNIDIDAPSPLKKRESPSFSTWFEKIYKELNE